MSEQDQATLEGGLNTENLEAVREELSGGFTHGSKGNPPPQRDTTPPATDQPQGE